MGVIIGARLGSPFGLQVVQNIGEHGIIVAKRTYFHCVVDPLFDDTTLGLGQGVILQVEIGLLFERVPIGKNDSYLSLGAQFFVLELVRRQSKLGILFLHLPGCGRKIHVGDMAHRSAGQIARNVGGILQPGRDVHHFVQNGAYITRLVVVGFFQLSARTVVNSVKPTFLRRNFRLWLAAVLNEIHLI